MGTKEETENFLSLYVCVYCSFVIYTGKFQLFLILVKAMYIFLVSKVFLLDCWKMESAGF